MTNIVYQNFLKITKIPRESGKEDKIANFLIKEAKKRNLEYHRDEHNNVIIKKPAKIENAKTIMLQGHTDMVCEKEDGSNFDFETMPIETYEENGWLKAKGTSLGADDGIGVAMMLSILDENTDNVNIEEIFTTSEETTMDGANQIDESLLSGKTMINLDGSEESVIEASCAGIICLDLLSNVKKEESGLTAYKISIKHLAGGHSGEYIGECRGNANKLITNFLNAINVKNIISFNGGTKYNVIPSSAECEFVSSLDESKLKKYVDSYKHLFKKIFIDCDQKFEFKLEKSKKKTQKNMVFSKKDTKKLIKFIFGFRNGVVVEDNRAFPIISNNIAIIRANEDVKISISVRGSNKKLLMKRLKKIKRTSRGFQFEITETSPMFEYKENSNLREIMVNTHEKLYGFKPEIRKIHACMEGGVFSGKIPNLDLATINCEIVDFHSIEERVNIDSMERTFAWLKKIIEEFAK